MGLGCPLFWLTTVFMCSPVSITKTYLYNFDSIKPHFYIVKLGFIGVYVIFLISAQKHRLWVLVRTASGGGYNEYSQSMFWAEIWKTSDFLSEKQHLNQNVTKEAMCLMQNSKDPDQPVQPRSLIRIFSVWSCRPVSSYFVLPLSLLSKIFSRRHFHFFFLLSQKIWLDISCK